MKIIALVLCIAITVTLTGCDLSEEFFSKKLWEKDMFDRFYNTDEDQAHKYFEQIIKSIENQDIDMMRPLFASDVILSTDLDSQIRELLSFCAGNLISYDISGPGSHASREDEIYYKEIFVSYDFSTTEGNYRMAYLVCTINSEHPEKVGLQSVYIIKAEESDLTYAYWGDNEWTPGITIE